ncbi:hypothetical protein ACFV4X_32510 [Streptomyces ardesiacus]|uniref:Uncharacterized protein n=2 Tax=Streptomyces ardesiacus TaxID=285564 RepID=A0ABW8HFY0_9ACTN
MGRTYEPYWAENSGQDYQEHAITPARGAASADGLQHSYMVLRSGQTSQWDILYDFNPVGRTQHQSQGYTHGFNLQLETNNLRDTSIGEMEDRFQYLATGDQWIRFDRTQVTTQVTANVCGPSSPPPYCFNAALTGGPKAVSWNVSKPATVAPARSMTQQKVLPAGRFVHGVDQNVLARCLAAAPSQCLERVPGLAKCVKARLVCNTTRPTLPSRTAGPQAASRNLDIAQTKRLAAMRFHLSDPQIQVRSTTTTAYDEAAGTDLAPQWGRDQPLWLVTSSAETRAENSKTHYHGLTAVYDPVSGQLLHAALGRQRAFQ